MASEDVEEFELHLSECETCQEAVKGLRRVVVYLSQEIAEDSEEQVAIRHGHGVLTPRPFWAFWRKRDSKLLRKAKEHQE